LNNLKSYESAIWSFTKPFSNAKAIKRHPKILNSKTQIVHMCLTTCRHILFIPPLIWDIFVALDAIGEGL
jgi:hypothetical protein